MRVLGHGRVDEDYRGAVVEFFPDGLEGSRAQVLAVVAGEEADAVGFEHVERVPDLREAAFVIVQAGHGGEEAEVGRVGFGDVGGPFIVLAGEGAGALFVREDVGTGGAEGEDGDADVELGVHLLGVVHGPFDHGHAGSITA